MRRALISLAGVFALLGIIGGTWVSRIPAISSGLQLSSGRLGLALLGLPVGSIAASVAMPRLLHRFGIHRVMAVAVFTNALALVLPPLAGGVETLALALFALGAAAGAIDVSMNSTASALQAQRAGSVFGRLHALWSFGGFAGTGVGAIAAANGVSPRLHLSMVAGSCAVVAVPILISLARATPHLTVSDADQPRARGWSRNRVVLSLSIASLAGFVVEVAAADWSGVFLRRDLAAGAGLAAGAYGAFALPHSLVRAAGDPIVDRVRGPRLLAGGLIVAALGWVVIATAQTALIVVLGLVVVGVGVSLVVPTAFAAAGRVDGVPRGSGVATAAGLGYVGWAATPGAIGGIAAGTTLRIALLLPAVVAAAAAVAVFATDLRRPS